MAIVATNLGTIPLNECGDIDSNAVQVFTNGHCHSFALAMYRRTGWPIIGVGMVGAWPRHCVVYCPTLDTYIDIEGAGAEARWNFGEGFMLLAPGDILSLPYCDPLPEMAVPFVENVLRKLPTTGSKGAAQC